MEMVFLKGKQMMRRRLIGPGLCFCVLAFPWLLAAEKVRVNYDTTFDFSPFRKYDWRTHPEMEKDPELAKKAIAGDIVMSEGNEILMGRGFQPGRSFTELLHHVFREGAAI